MPPKAKITKEMILNTVLDITREAGFESVNARSISGRLQCSTRPIFTCYENMDELKREFLDYAYEFYSQYVEDFSSSEHINPCLVLPLSYIEFAKEETNLFRLLFINHMDLSMAEPKDFYMEAGNGERERVFSDAIGIEPEPGKSNIHGFIPLFPWHSSFGSGAKNNIRQEPHRKNGCKHADSSHKTGKTGLDIIPLAVCPNQ